MLSTVLCSVQLPAGIPAGQGGRPLRSSAHLSPQVMPPALGPQPGPPARSINDLPVSRGVPPASACKRFTAARCSADGLCCTPGVGTQGKVDAPMHLCAYASAHAPIGALPRPGLPAGLGAGHAPLQRAAVGVGLVALAGGPIVTEHVQTLACKPPPAQAHTAAERKSRLQGER